MTILNSLGLTALAASQANRHILVNTNDAWGLMNMVACVAKGTSTPPGSPAEGDRHIIGSSPTGAWSTFTEDNIAGYINGAWVEMDAVDRLVALVDNAGAVQMWMYDSGTGNWAQTTLGAGTVSFFLEVAVGDEDTVITTGTAKLTFRMPAAVTLTAVRASLKTASSSGLVTVDINEGGTTILSTKLTIDASEKTSTTAATAAVISDASLADDAEMTIDIDGAGTGATGLKVVLIGTLA